MISPPNSDKLFSWVPLIVGPSCSISRMLALDSAKGFKEVFLGIAWSLGVHRFWRDVVRRLSVQAQAQSFSNRLASGLCSIIYVGQHRSEVYLHLPRVDAGPGGCKAPIGRAQENTLRDSSCGSRPALQRSRSAPVCDRSPLKWQRTAWTCPLAGSVPWSRRKLLLEFLVKAPSATANDATWASFTAVSTGEKSTDTLFSMMLSSTGLKSMAGCLRQS